MFSRPSGRMLVVLIPLTHLLILFGRRLGRRDYLGFGLPAFSRSAL